MLPKYQKMKRRSFLKSIRPNVATQAIKVEALKNGFSPYTGPWTKLETAHLLRRTLMSFDMDSLQKFTNAGLSFTIDTLFTTTPISDFPLNFDYEEDDEVPIGETWINAKYDIGNGVRNYRYQSLKAWFTGRSISGEESIRHKLVLFWHNHFAISDIRDGRYLWKYIMLLHDNFDGNFKKLVEEITIDPSMLRFLNGNQNTKRAPNENYARELLELFTIGKGEQVGPGDYTNYTEEDVSAIAKVLTGWRDYNYRSTSNEGFGSRFVPNNHDVTDKLLSHRFDKLVIKNNEEQEYKDLIAIIFSKNEVARFICRKLYRWFVYYEITPETESEIIEPMSQVLINNQYKIGPALKALLKSEHFYSSKILGGMIKNPHDFMSSVAVPMKFSYNQSLAQKYTYLQSWARYQALLQMDSFELPSVAGWKAYYQTPSFYRGWINAVTLPARVQFSTALLVRGNVTGGINQRIDVVAFLKTLPNPGNIDSVITTLNDLMFAKPFTSSQITSMKKTFNPGKSDADWATEYQAMINAPNDEAARRNIENKFALLLAYMTYMPEFQLI